MLQPVFRLLWQFVFLIELDDITVASPKNFLVWIFLEQSYKHNYAQRLALPLTFLPPPNRIYTRYILPVSLSPGSYMAYNDLEVGSPLF